MGPLEAFSGLYKAAAILHFPVSAVPAESILTDCGGSGRGLPADARLHVFLHFFPFQSVFFFTLRDPSGRTCCVDKGRLQHSNCGLRTVSPSFRVGLSRNGAGCCVRADRVMLLLLLSRQIFGICQPPPRGEHTYFIDDTHWLYDGTFGPSDKG